MDYNTIFDRAEASFTEKKSEFIGYICPVRTNDEAIQFINEIRAKHRKATHNVYAYILREQSTSRYSDDGEPQGTAGVPVLDVLKKEGLTDVCCVVTRYFGGILLGGGGLVRAYSHSAKIAVDASERMIMCCCFRVDFSVDYNMYGKITYILPDFDVKIIDTVFDSDIKISLYIKAPLFSDFQKKITDISNGTVCLLKSDEMYENFA